MHRPFIALSFVAFVALMSVGGCYINPSAPLRYYRAPKKLDLARLPARLPGAPRGRLATPPRALVMPLWTSLVTNPVGGLYDHDASGIVPLQATFFHPNVAMPIWEAAARRFRRYGLPTYKDYTDVGTATLLTNLARARQDARRPAGDGTALPRQLLILRGRLRSLVHEQDRDPRSKVRAFEAVRATVEIDLLDASGRVLWRKALSVFVKKPAGHNADLLAALGASISDAILRGGPLYRLLGATGKTRPVIASRPLPPASRAPAVAPRVRAVPRRAATRRQRIATRISPQHGSASSAPRHPSHATAVRPAPDGRLLVDSLGAFGGSL